MSVAYTRVGPAPVSPLARSFMVPMRDRVRLATDVYLPDGDASPGPTVLIRLPYDKCGEYAFIPQVAEYVSRHGYRVVAQDVRGKFRSEGETLVFVNEVYDGYDTLDWIVQQEWSDGTVGMLGDSYYGYTQWAAVSSGHQALRAIAPRVTGTRLGELPAAASDGRTSGIEMAIQRLYTATAFHGHDTYDWDVDWSRRPYSASVEEFFATVGSRSPSWDQWFPHPVTLRRFPNGCPFDARSVPVLQTIGWWDNCAPWQWADQFELMRRPSWAAHLYLIVESMDHECYYLNGDAPAEERGPGWIGQALPSSLDPTLEFFDVFVRGGASADSIPRVRWNLAHTPGWRVASTWPPPDTRRLGLYLTPAGGLSATPPASEAVLSWTHDPDNLVPSPVENAFGFLLEYPDESGWSDRDDVLAFTGEAVDGPIDLIGGVELRATVASSGRVMDVFARLLDVAGDGAARLIARGQLQVLDAAQHTEVAVSLGQVGYRLRSGHRLRLHIASSDFPEYLPQPGTGVNPWLAEGVARNEQSLRVGGASGARLFLGVDTRTSRATDPVGT